MFKDKINLKVFVAPDQYIQDITTNEFTKWYEEKTNIHIEWNVVLGSVKEKLNITLASGDYPDAFLNAGFTQVEQMGYGQQGILKPLNNLISKYGPELTKAINEKEWAKKQITAIDNNIYALPSISETYHGRMPKKMWVYKPWLKQLNMQEPQSTEEFYNMLKEFKMLGDGVVPLSGANAPNNSILPYIMNSFIYTDDATYLMLDNDKVKFVANTPEFKEGLKFLRKLTTEKLLDPLSFTQDRKALTRLAENPGHNMVGAVPALAWIHFTTDGGKSGRYKEFSTIPPLKGPQGVRYSFDRGYLAGQGVFAISNKCKYPEAAMRWIDWFYTQEGAYLSTMGKENVGWRYAKEGEKGVDGRPAVFKRIIPFGTIGNSTWSQVPPAYMTLEQRFSEAVDDPENNIEKRLTDETKKNYEPYSGRAMTLPSMFFNEEDSKVINNLNKTILDFLNQSTSKFILGKDDIDSGWDRYVNELNKIGLEQYIKIYQQTYDENNK